MSVGRRIETAVLINKVKSHDKSSDYSAVLCNPEGGIEPNCRKTIMAANVTTQKPMKYFAGKAKILKTAGESVVVEVD